MPRPWQAFVCTVFVLIATGANAQLTIYDDALQNAWQNWSYGGGSNFDNTTPVYAGVKSIAFIPNETFNAVSFARPGQPVNTGTYPVLRFWIHGGVSGGQALNISLDSGPQEGVASGPLNSYIAGGGIAAGQWREVSVTLTTLTALPGWDGAFDRINLQTATGAQPTLYMDEFALQPPAAPSNAMLIERDVVVTDMLSDRFTWFDSAGLPRTAVLAHPTTGVSYPGIGTLHGGAMREFRYRLPNGATRIAGPTTYGNGGYGGFGYVVSHASRTAGCVGDDSPLGNYVPIGRFYRVFEGRHHAIFRFKQYYPRNCATTPDAVAPYRMPATIDWLFTTGRDHPLWAITYDVDGAFRTANGAIAPAGTFWDDSRAPYGELNIDGDGWTELDGVAWGDRWRFTSTGTTPVTMGRSWTWNVPNTVPYVKVWMNGPLVGNTRDATMGIVQTQTNAQQDAGGGRDPDVGSNIVPLWNTTSATWGNACADPLYVFPCANDWPYQAIGNSLEYEYVFNGGSGTNNARMTWKTQYGFLGRLTYPLNDGSGGTAPGYPKKSYSTYVVLGTHTSSPVETQRIQVETIQSVVLTINGGLGSVTLSGPAGNVRADNVTYQPPGYNHVYGALAFNASGNMLDANVSVGAGTLRKPLIIVGNYTAANPTVKFGGVTLVADVDYFASIRRDKNELWITLNRDLAGPTNRVEVLGICQQPVIATPASVVPGATGITASVTNNAGSTYAWTLTGGSITGGQGTASIQYDAGPAGTRMTLSVVETAAGCGTLTASLRVMVDFLDVPSSHPQHDFVIKLARNGVTAGCGGGNYCPTSPVTRAQMAVFLLVSKYGESYVPPPAVGIFNDVPPGPFAPWIEQLYNEGITAGCSTSPPLYCPSNPVTRAQMAAFLMSSKHGRLYVAPPPIGIFDDVPTSNPFARWIEKLYGEGITSGCSVNPPLYCPGNSTTRGQMAVFLSVTFNLP